MSEPWQLPDEPLVLQHLTLQRLRAVLEGAEKKANQAIEHGRLMFRTPAQEFRERVDELLRRAHGWGLRGPSISLSVHAAHESGNLAEVLSATRFALNHLRQIPGAIGVTYISQFEESVNEIIESECPFAMDGGAWTRRVDAEADRLLATLLKDAGEVATCKQGDIQVEMVACSAQPFLGRDDLVIVDYGAGLGRVGHGLSATTDFVLAEYVAVDEPVCDDLKKTLAGLTCKKRIVLRSAYLADPVPADVLLIVNVMHHIPFREIAWQLDAMLRSLKTGGVMIVHEMGELREPEKGNVPWTTSDVERLLDLPGVRAVPRSTTTSGKKVPLAHVVVRVDEPQPSYEKGLASHAEAVWSEMKERTVASIRELYERGNPKDVVPLRHALITNANLDLNRPQAARSQTQDSLSPSGT